MIYDASTHDTLVRCPMPPDLTEAAKRVRQQLVALFAEHKLPPPAENEGRTYAAPEQGRRLKSTLRLPQTHTREIDAVPSLAEAARSLPTPKPGQLERVERYAELCEAANDGFDGEHWCRQQLLGGPMPEQDDPRYGAVVWSRFGKPYLSSEEWETHHDELVAAAREWRLLLQLDLSDWTQAQFTEGTVYFLIRTADLAARRFERVVGVYQQS